MASELGYFTIPAADMKRARAFYGSLFGWEFAPDADDRYSHVGNVQLPGGLHGEGQGSSPQVWFKVPDIKAAVAKVRELGGHAEEPTQSATGWSTACRDNQGINFNIWEPAAGF